MSAHADRIAAVLRAHTPIDISGGGDSAGKIFCCETMFGDENWDEWIAHVTRHITDALHLFDETHWVRTSVDGEYQHAVVGWVPA